MRALAGLKRHGPAEQGELSNQVITEKCNPPDSHSQSVNRFEKRTSVNSALIRPFYISPPKAWNVHLMESMNYIGVVNYLECKAR